MSKKIKKFSSEVINLHNSINIQSFRPSYNETVWRQAESQAFIIINHHQRHGQGERNPLLIKRADDRLITTHAIKMGFLCLTCSCKFIVFFLSLSLSLSPVNPPENFKRIRETCSIQEVVSYYCTQAPFILFFYQVILSKKYVQNALNAFDTLLFLLLAAILLFWEYIK